MLYAGQYISVFYAKNILLPSILMVFSHSGSRDISESRIVPKYSYCFTNSMVRRFDVQFFESGILASFARELRSMEKII